MRIQSMPFVPVYQSVANNNNHSRVNNSLKQKDPITFGYARLTWWDLHGDEVFGCGGLGFVALIAAFFMYSCLRGDDPDEVEEQRVDVNYKFRNMLDNVYMQPESDGGINITDKEIDEREKIINLFDSITKGVSYLDYDKERVRVNSVRDHAISNITNPESENGTLISDKEQKMFLKELQIAMDEMKKNSK